LFYSSNIKKQKSMKTKFAAAVLCLASLVLPVSTVLAQGTLFTYQGQLTGASGPANGTYNMTFQLWTASTGGSQAGSTITTNGVVIVTNGLFTVYLDFGNQYSTGTSYWLQLGVETNGGGSFATLTPRQQLTPTPYAIFAEGANASGLTGTIPMASLNGIYGDAINLDNPGDSFTGNGAGLTGVNASLLGGLTSSNFWQTTGNFGTTAGPNFVGTTDNQPLYVDSDGDRGLELQFVSRSLFPILGNLQAMNIAGGYWGNTISNGVIGATIAGGGDQEFIFQIGGGGESYYPNIVGGDFGSVGGGYANNAAGYGGTVPGGYENIASGQASFAAGSYAQALHNGSFVWSDGSATRSDTGVNQFLIFASGGVGIGTASPASKLEVNGDIRTDGNPVEVYPAGSAFSSDGMEWGTGTLPGINFGDGPFVCGYEGGALGALNPNTICLSWDYNGNVWVSNNCSVASLTIRGGADLAEPFQMSPAQLEMQPGSVVVIDDEHPGQLKLSDQPYDTRVAGVVSGANGIHPGIQMHQQGLLEGGKNVALTGRVYVRADASYGAIRPGDFLTTSATPGYAMKVTDHERAQGAILGKAMTGLNHGTGMVLVLVTLQ
jgi:hypothetical protein